MLDSTDFKQLFTPIAPEQIPDDVFTLAGKIFPVITAGTRGRYNSMTASGGGMGLHFRKPVTYCLLASRRYTLELIQEARTYTLSYFPDEYQRQVIFLGSESGRESDKMQKVELTAVETPVGNISFKEARLIIECALTQITTPGIEDFSSQETRDYLSKTYADAGEVRKYVFGEITQTWVKRERPGGQVRTATAVGQQQAADA